MKSSTKPNVWRLVCVTIFHLFPLLPFVEGRFYFGIAAVLLVALPYIKTAKLNTYIKALEGVDSDGAQRERQSLTVTRDRWRSLTYLAQ